MSRRRPRTLGGEPLSVGRDGASDAVSFLRAGIPAVEFGPVGSGHHGPEEWVSIPSLADYRRALTDFILGLPEARVSREAGAKGAARIRTIDASRPARRGGAATGLTEEFEAEFGDEFGADVEDELVNEEEPEAQADEEASPETADREALEVLSQETVEADVLALGDAEEERERSEREAAEATAAAEEEEDDQAEEEEARRGGAPVRTSRGETSRKPARGGRRGRRPGRGRRAKRSRRTTRRRRSACGRASSPRRS